MHGVGKACDGILSSASFPHFRPRQNDVYVQRDNVMIRILFRATFYCTHDEYTWARPLLIGPKAVLSWIIDEGINFISIAQSCLTRPCYRNIIDFWQQIRWTRFSGFGRPRRRKSHSKPNWYAIAHSCSQLVFHYSRQGRLHLQADTRFGGSSSPIPAIGWLSCREVFSAEFLRRFWPDVKFDSVIVVLFNNNEITLINYWRSWAHSVRCVWRRALINGIQID